MVGEEVCVFFQNSKEAGEPLGLLNADGEFRATQHFEFVYPSYTKEFFMRDGVSMVRLTYNDGHVQERLRNFDEILLTELMRCQSWQCIDPPLFHANDINNHLSENIQVFKNIMETTDKTNIRKTNLLYDPHPQRIH